MKKISDFIDKVLYISDGSSPRKEWLDQFLSTLGLLEKAERIPAVFHQGDIPEWFSRQGGKKDGRIINPQRFRGAYGCTLAHLNCFKKVKQEKWDKTLILEDDVEGLAPYEKYIEYLSAVPETFDLSYLFRKREADGSFVLNNYVEKISGQYGGYAYIVTQKKIDELIYLGDPTIERERNSRTKGGWNDAVLRFELTNWQIYRPLIDLVRVHGSSRKIHNTMLKVIN